MLTPLLLLLLLEPSVPPSLSARKVLSANGDVGCVQYLTAWLAGTHQTSSSSQDPLLSSHTPSLEPSRTTAKCTLAQPSLLGCMLTGCSLTALVPHCTATVVPAAADTLSATLGQLAPCPDDELSPSTDSRGTSRTVLPPGVSTTAAGMAKLRETNHWLLQLKSGSELTAKTCMWQQVTHA